MRELTFVGFLSRYVRELSMSGTNSISKLAREAATNNYRLREPLLLYALFSDNSALHLSSDTRWLFFQRVGCLSGQPFF